MDGWMYILGWSVEGLWRCGVVCVCDRRGTCLFIYSEILLCLMCCGWLDGWRWRLRGGLAGVLLVWMREEGGRVLKGKGRGGCPGGDLEEGVSMSFGELPALSGRWIWGVRGRRGCW